VPERRFDRQALAARRPTSQRRHIGLGPGLVDGDEPRGINAGPEFQPLLAPSCDIGAFPLAGDQRLSL